MTNPKSDIFCPNCSAKNKIEQNFCRFCGFNLQDTTKSLIAQLSIDKTARQFNQLKLIKKLTDSASVGLVVIVSTGILFYLYAVLTQMVFSGKRVLLGLFLIYMVFQFFGRFIRRILRNRIIEDGAETDSPPKELEEKETAKLLEEKPFARAAGLKENSTELLFAENKTRKLG
jgi:hypothetical protein